MLKFSSWKWVAVNATACLACGVVTTYLDEAALAKMRAWHSTATKK